MASERTSFLGEKSVELLEAAAPGLPVIAARDRWHGDHARATLTSAKCVQFAYLLAAPGAQLALHLYPADTLGQARFLYRDTARVAQLLSLRDDGWELRPNFHFGFMTSGLTWTTSRLTTDEYVTYWIDRIDTLFEFPRDDWEPELQRLITDGIFDPKHLPQFDRDFTDTKRQGASPRPGLRLERSWLLTEALAPGFAEREIRARLRQALVALGEPRTARDLSA